MQLLIIVSVLVALAICYKFRSKIHLSKLLRWLIFTVLISLLPFMFTGMRIYTNIEFRSTVIQAHREFELTSQKLSGVNQPSIETISTDKNQVGNNKETKIFWRIVDYILSDGSMFLIITCMCATAAGELVGVLKITRKKGEGNEEEDQKEVRRLKAWRTASIICGGGCIAIAFACIFAYMDTTYYINQGMEFDRLFTAKVAFGLFFGGIGAGSASIMLSEVN